MPKRQAVIEVRKPEVGAPIIAVWFTSDIKDVSLTAYDTALALAGRPMGLEEADGGLETCIMPVDKTDAGLASTSETLRLRIIHYLGFNAHVASAKALAA